MAENATAGRIAVDQEYRYAALTTLLDRELAVRCDDGVLPSRTVHARYPCLLASANGHYSPFIDLVISPPQEGCRLLAYHDARRHCVAGRYTWQNGSVGNAEAIDAVDLQFAIDHRHSIAAHSCRSTLMPESAKPVAKENL
jgi:hypothetical protein